MSRKLAPAQHSTHRYATGTLLTALKTCAELTRIHQPHGICLALFTHTLGLLYAMTVSQDTAQLWPTAYTACRLLSWIIFCRSAACAWNDVVDQDYDRQTIRCRNRPIARGALTSTHGCLIASVLMALAILSLRGLPYGSIRMAFLAIVLSTVYPFAKRFTNFPQILLGAIAGVTIPLAAYAAGLDALSSSLRTPTICLMSTVMVHLIFYDVAYARQDVLDDMKSGVKSMAVLYHGQIPLLLGVLACVAANLVYWLGRIVDYDPAFFTIAVGGQIVGLGSLVVLVQLGLETRMKRMGGWCFATAFGSVLAGFASQVHV